MTSTIHRWCPGCRRSASGPLCPDCGTATAPMAPGAPSTVPARSQPAVTVGQLATAYYFARRLAWRWLAGGLLFLALGVATLVRADWHGGIVWSGAIGVGVIIVFRSLRQFKRLAAMRRHLRAGRPM